MVNAELIAIACLILLLLIALLIIGRLGLVLSSTRRQLSRYQGLMNIETEQAKIKAATIKLRQKNQNLKAEQDILKRIKGNS